MKFVLNILMEDFFGEKFVSTDTVCPIEDPNCIAIFEEYLKYKTTGELSKDHRHQAMLCVAMIDEFDELLCPDDILDIIEDAVIEDLLTEAYHFDLGGQFEVEENSNTSEWKDHKILDYSFECITDDNAFEVVPKYCFSDDEEGRLIVEFLPKENPQLKL